MHPSADKNDLIAALLSGYGIEVVALERIRAGSETRNWMAVGTKGRFFVKEYPLAIAVADIRATLELTEYARQCGIPTPQIIPTRTGEPIYTSAPYLLSVSQYCADCSSGLALSQEQMAIAGATLGQIHRNFSARTTSYAPITPRWLQVNPTAKINEIEQYLQIIREKPFQDDFDTTAYTLLQRKQQLIADHLAAVLSRAGDLTTQVMHGDYSSTNLLFQGAQLVAVIDFRKPEPFLISYELGRIAFLPENLIGAGWEEKALALVQGYIEEYRCPRQDVALAPAMWLAQLLRSLYGVREHYSMPVEQQAGLDQFWQLRENATELLVANLPCLENRFGEIWDDAL
jgi:Ser/Thr protein kinase RdoA (MazF antagonist)